MLNNSLWKHAAVKLLLIVGVYLSHLLLLDWERKRNHVVLIDLSIPHSAVERCKGYFWLTQWLTMSEEKLLQSQYKKLCLPFVLPFNTFLLLKENSQTEVKIEMSWHFNGNYHFCLRRKYLLNLIWNCQWICSPQNYISLVSSNSHAEIMRLACKTETEVYGFYLTGIWGLKFMFSGFSSEKWG